MTVDGMLGKQIYVTVTNCTFFVLPALNKCRFCQLAQFVEKFARGAKKKLPTAARTFLITVISQGQVEQRKNTKCSTTERKTLSVGSFSFVFVLLDF